MLEEVTAALAAIEGEGTFAAEETCAADALRIQVERVGPLSFPITAADARGLIAVARPAPYGKRDQTLYDKRVRDTWEIERSRIKIDTPAWKRVLDPALATLRERLGIPAEGKLRAVLDKMLIYGPGQFFAPHQDSERADDMIGTLVVDLPSRYKGGALVVQHGAEKKVFRRAERRGKGVSLVAFYADCPHEVEPVESGYRVALIYQLHHPGGASSSVGAGIDQLAESVEKHFATPIPPRYGDKPARRPDRLVYLLDHEYTEASFGWERLKNADRIRVGALREVAGRLDCDVYLALAEVHEVWDCEDKGYGFRHRGYWDDEDDQDDEDDVEGHTLTDLIDSNVELRHWIGPEGEAVPGVPGRAVEHELCSTVESREMPAWRSDYEGYMGNYGNTMDRWYHRAALVMWPRARSFVLRAEVSSPWAAKELAKRIKAGALDEAREKARSLLPFWDHAARDAGGDAFVADLLGVARALDDADLAIGLLRPLGPHRLTPKVAPAFAALVEQRGSAWGQQLFGTWSERTHFGAPPWRALLPGICRALVGRAAEPGRALATWLVRREVASFQKRIADSLKTPAGLRRKESWAEHGADLALLLEAIQAVRDASTHDALLAFLTAPETALPPLVAGALLQACLKRRTPVEARALALGALHRHAVGALEAALATPLRSPDDWSIELPGDCKCDLCKELSAFLRAPDRVQLAWPLAKERRQHVHGTIDRHTLPVSHETDRRGRPYTLVLRKQPALFDREAARREEEKAMLGSLRKNRAAFGG